MKEAQTAGAIPAVPDEETEAQQDGAMAPRLQQALQEARHGGGTQARWSRLGWERSWRLGHALGAAWVAQWPARLRFQGLQGRGT